MDGRYTFTWLSDAGSSGDVKCFLQEVSNVGPDAIYVRWQLTKLDDSIAGRGKWAQSYTVEAEAIGKDSGPLEYTFIRPPKTTPTSVYKPADPPAGGAEQRKGPDGSPKRTAAGKVETKTTLKDGTEYTASIITLSEVEPSTSGEWKYRLRIEDSLRTKPGVKWIQEAHSKSITKEIAAYVRNYPQVPINLIEPFDRTFTSKEPPRSIFAPLILVKPDASEASIGLMPAYVPRE